MKHRYIIVDDSEKSELETRMIMRGFPDFIHVHSAFNFEDAIDSILKYRPTLVFLEISPDNAKNKLSLYLISEVYRLLTVIPKFIIITKNPNLALEAIGFNVFDYLIKPLEANTIRRSLVKFEKSFGRELLEEICILDIQEKQDSCEEAIETVENEVGDVSYSEESVLLTKSTEGFLERPLVLCIKSYGDHRYIEASAIQYLKADNNSTDLYLKNGEVITAFKTLKNFEMSLPFPFMRIHNSFIINSTQVARIHLGNSLCYIRDTSVKIPFSKSYKDSIDKLITFFENGNYVEF